MTWDCSLAWNASQILMCERLGVQTGTVSKLGSLWEMVLSWEDCWLLRCALKGVVTAQSLLFPLLPDHEEHGCHSFSTIPIHRPYWSRQIYIFTATIFTTVDPNKHFHLVSWWSQVFVTVTESDLRAICLPCNYGQLLSQCNRDINIRSMKSSFPSTAEGLTLTFNFHHMLHLVYSLIIQVMTVFPVWATV